MNAALIDPPSQIAMLLDPRVRTKSIMNYPKALAVKPLSDAFLAFPTTLFTYRGAQAAPLRHSDGASDVIEIAESEPKRVKCSLRLPEESTSPAVAVSELDAFFAEPGIALDACPMEWWRQRKTRFPVLFEMAYVYLAVPASSAPSERVFSAAKLVLTDKRKQLLESRVARQVFMTRNMKVYNELRKLTKASS